MSKFVRNIEVDPDCAIGTKCVQSFSAIDWMISLAKTSSILELRGASKAAFWESEDPEKQLGKGAGKHLTSDQKVGSSSPHGCIAEYEVLARIGANWRNQICALLRHSVTSH
jgi:hypothetical protein